MASEGLRQSSVAHLADRPEAVAALARIFLDEIERLLLDAAGMTHDADTPASPRPRLVAVSFLHRPADHAGGPGDPRHGQPAEPDQHSVMRSEKTKPLTTP